MAATRTVIYSPAVSAARRRRRASAPQLLVVVVVAIAAVLYLRYGQSHAQAGSRPSTTTPHTTPGRLAATPVNGHVTGTAPTSCQERRATDGQPLPDRSCTPGVVSTAVSQSNIGSTICHSGYTQTVRPPESDTERFKQKIMIAYHEPGPLSDYELDHLVSLELGGSNDAGNLWPEHNDHPKGAINSKDLVENALNKAVCDNQVTLAAAQNAIATDWTTALATLGLPPTS